MLTIVAAILSVTGTKTIPKDLGIWIMRDKMFNGLAICDWKFDWTHAEAVTSYDSFDLCDCSDFWFEAWTDRETR